AIAERGLPAVVLRPGQIFGPGAETVTPNATLALAGRWVAVGDGAQTLPLVYIDDVVDALLRAADTPAATGRMFNLVDPATVTLREYLQHARRKSPQLRVLRTPAWPL